MERGFTRKCSKNVSCTMLTAWVTWSGENLGIGVQRTWDAFLTIKAFLLPTSQSGLKLSSEIIHIQVL